MVGFIDGKTHKLLLKYLINIISETNGISLVDTLELLANSEIKNENRRAHELIESFRKLISLFQQNEASILHLLEHPVSQVLFNFFQIFPLKYHEEHIHLTGALNAEFLFPRLKVLFDGPQRTLYEKKIKEVYGPNSWPITSAQDVDNLIRLKESEGFGTYLRILYLPKLILVNREAHSDSAYHIAKELYHKFNVGKIRLKFSLSRVSTNSHEQIPGADDVSPEDVILGLYDGFKNFQNRHPDFNFVLSPSFRKEASFFDAQNYKTRNSSHL